MVPMFLDNDNANELEDINKTLQELNNIEIMSLLEDSSVATVTDHKNLLQGLLERHEIITNNANPGQQLVANDFNAEDEDAVVS